MKGDCNENMEEDIAAWVVNKRLLPFLSFSFVKILEAFHFRKKQTVKGVKRDEKPLSL